MENTMLKIAQNVCFDCKLAEVSFGDGAWKQEVEAPIAGAH